MKTYRHIRVSDDGKRVRSLEPVFSDEVPLWADEVCQEVSTGWSSSDVQDAPCFKDPIPFVIPPPEDSDEPFCSHNHCPALTWCDNGDLLAAWFSTESEAGTEMTILASRLRKGAREWEPAGEFFNAPGRNMTGTALFNDGHGKIHHFNGMGPEGEKGWENLVAVLRTSEDNGVSWSRPRVVSTGARYQRRNQIIAGTSVTPGGLWLQPCDATPGGQGPTALYISRDQGKSWHDPGGDIRGIHAGVVGLKDGRLMALGRGREINGCMPMSLSASQARSWEYKASEFPPLSGGQRLVLMRLRGGQIMLASFTDPSSRLTEGRCRGMEFKGTDGRNFTGYGMFAALSFDEGRSWPVRRLLTPGRGTYDGGAWTGRFHAAPHRAEPRGYLAAAQTPDGLIHLVSSRLHYRFNLSWLTAHLPPASIPHIASERRPD